MRRWQFTIRTVAGWKLIELKEVTPRRQTNNLFFNGGLHTTVHGTLLICPVSSTLGCASTPLRSCFNFCSTAAGSIARGNNLECLAGCSRCNTTRRDFDSSARPAKSFSSEAFAFTRAQGSAARVSRTLHAISIGNSEGFVRRVYTIILNFDKPGASFR